MDNHFGSGPKACPGCGNQLHEFLMTGRIHCQICLYHFWAEAKPLVQKYQDGACQHLGKWPAKRNGQVIKRDEIYQKAIEQAQVDGRWQDVEIFSDIMDLLEEH